MQRALSTLASNLILALIYCAAGRLGLSLAFLHESASPVWPPSGIAIAVVLLYGPRLLPGIFLGAILVNLLTDASFSAILGIAVGNTLEAFVGAYLAERYAQGKAAFERVASLTRFIVCAALPATLLSASIGVASLCLAGSAAWPDFRSLWVTWWLGDFVSAVIVTPALVVWLAPSKTKPRTGQAGPLELVALGAALLLASVLAFGNILHGGNLRYPLDFLLIPVLLWASYRFEQRGAASASLLISAIAIVATLKGFGPFEPFERNTSLILLQAFMGTITVTSLVLAAVVSERHVLEEQRHAQQQALQESEIRFQTLANGSPVLLWVNGLDGCQFVNNAYLKFLGVTDIDVSGYDFGRFIHTADRDVYIQAYLDAFTARADFSADFRFLRHDGAWRWMRSVARPRIGPEGAFLGYVGATLDITDQKAAETALHDAHLQLADRAVHLEALIEKRTAELKESLGELEAFSYSVSHDMRAPLRAMTSFAEALTTEKSAMLDAEAKDYVDRIYRGAKRLDLLVQDILAYAKVSKAAMNLAPVNLESICDEIIRSHPDLQEPRARMIVEKPLQPVLAHEAFLAQILSNLLSNAVKFVRAGEIPVVRLWSERIPEDAVRVWVEDNGIGIPEDQQNKIFTIFGRLNPEKTYPGSGIGLSIVKRAVSRMGGDVGVESKEGQGSRFWFTLRGSDQTALLELRH